MDVLADGLIQQPCSERQNAVDTVATHANVAAVSRAQVTTQPCDFRDAVTEATYVDQRARERGAKSVVASGLQPSVSVTLRPLCTLELSVDAAITFTRRLRVAAAGDRVRHALLQCVFSQRRT